MSDIATHTRRKFLILTAFEQAGAPLPYLQSMEIIKGLGRRHFGDEEAVYDAVNLEGAMHDLFCINHLKFSEAGIEITKRGQQCLKRTKRNFFPEMQIL